MPIARTVESDRTPAQAAAMRRSRGEDAAPVPTHSSAHVPDEVRTIPGWGTDLDPARPAGPTEIPSESRSLRGDVRHWQVPTDRIHVSNEHPNLTPVFGTSCPPRGLSGALRDGAYQYGEGTNRRWMTLLLADRVDELESRLRERWRRGGEGGRDVRPALVLGALAAVGLVWLLRRRS